MAKEEPIEAEGVVVEKLPNRQFRVDLDNGNRVLGFLSGKMKMNKIDVLPGDRVRMEFSPYDLSKGRITFREH